MKALFAVTTILISLSVSTLAYSAQSTGEWWEVTQKMEMPGMPDFSSMMPGGGASKVCMSSDLEKQPFNAGEDAKNCVISDVKTSGKTTTFKMKCSGENALTGSGEITRNSDSFSQKVKVQSSDGDMLLVSTGKRIGGACSVEEEISKLTNSAEKAGIKTSAAAAANTDKFCEVDTKSLDPQMLGFGWKYFDSGSGSNKVVAPCKAEQSTYCTQAKKVASLPAGYRKYAEIRRAFVENPELATAMYYFDSVEICKIDPAPLLQNACASATKDISKNSPWKADEQGSRAGFDDWNFMTNYCPADADSYYKKTCANWQNDRSADTSHYSWCNSQQDWKSNRMSNSSFAPQTTNTVNPTPDSETVEQTKTKAVTEGVTKGVTKGIGVLKGLFK